MTVVCCWLDDSYSRRRITAIADGRASKRENGKWVPVTEETTKLYRCRVNCYRGLDTMSGTWSDPYYATEIGIGFAGHCFEAMSIIALYLRCVGQLVVDGDHSPRPKPGKLVEMLTEIVTRWFRCHYSGGEQHVEFLLFGFSPGDGQAWAAKVVRRAGKDADLTEFSLPLDAQSVYSVGDVGQKPAFEAAVAKIRRRIQSHASDIKQGAGTEGRYDHELEIARHKSADKKSVEQLVLDEMSNEFSVTVGGVLQKIEVIAWEDNRGVVSFSRNDQRHILDCLPEVGDRLYYIPLAERMGWP